VVELNDMSDTGSAQSDGAMVQLTIGVQPGSEIRYNWFHDTIKSGARFDAPVPPVRWGHGGAMHHNVIWNTGRGLVVKGQRHRVYHNTCLDTERQGIVIVDDKEDGGGGNAGTLTVGNFAYSMSGQRRKAVPVPGVSRFNWNGNQHDEHGIDLLRAPCNLDFRPRPGSPLIDAARPIDGIDHAAQGPAPDIGAYEYDDPHYWIPGRQLLRASRPVPPDGARISRRDVGLMWLGGYGAEAHEVYFGRDRAAIKNAPPRSPAYRGRWHDRNIFAPAGLQAGTYYWRVDAIRNGRPVVGPVWRFHAAEESTLPNRKE
jgi:hypothetical protein